MKKTVKVLILLVLIGIFLFSGGKLLYYYLTARENIQKSNALVEEFVVIHPISSEHATMELPEHADETEKYEHDLPSSHGSVDPSVTEQEQEPDSEPESKPAEDSVPIVVNFDLLQERYPDCVGWLYSPATPINYPIMQSKDNDYYLRRSYDGSYNRCGSLFLDFRCTSDLSDSLSLIYGHNMKNDTMLGTLERYTDQAYYEAHREMYLLTRDADYVLRPFAGCVVPDNSGYYRIPLETPVEDYATAA
jgi:SrtB family sortase